MTYQSSIDDAAAEWFLDRDPISIHLFGKDHWSTFAYAEHCAVERKPLDKEKMRCDADRHPLQANSGNRLSFSTTKYPSIIKPAGLDEGKTLVADHDDWDCIEDLEAAGLLELHTLTNPFVKLTDLGWKVSTELRAHKAQGKNFHGFSPSIVLE